MLSKLQRQRPSHATVVAYLALFVALGGTGYAASKNGGDQSRAIPANTPLTATKQQGKKVRRAPRVRRAQVGSAAAAAGAYALISRTGGLSRAHNVTSVSNPARGVYCVKTAPGIDVTKAVPIVTPDFANDATSFNEPGGTYPTLQAVVEARSDQIYSCPDGFPVVTGHQEKNGGPLVRSDQGFWFSVPGAGLSGLQRVEAQSGLEPIGHKKKTVYCPSGKRLLGAGGVITKPDGAELPEVVISGINPTFGLDGAIVSGQSYRYSSSEEWGVRAIGICAYAP